MALSLGDTAPDFEAETTQGKIKFHDWIGDSWAVLFSHPKDFTPVCTTELGYMASIKPEFDKRNVKIIGLSVDPVEKHGKWAEDIKETQGFAPNYPMIGDTDYNVSKLYGMLPAAVSGDPAKRTPADNQTVRNVFVIGPDKKVKLILVYPMTTGRNFDEVLRVIELAAADGEAQGGDAGAVEAGRGRDHRRLRVRRRRQEDLSPGLEIAEALHPHRTAAALKRHKLPRGAGDRAPSHLAPCYGGKVVFDPTLARAAFRLIDGCDPREVIALRRVEQQRIGERHRATGVAEGFDFALLLEAQSALLKDGVAYLPQDIATLLCQVRLPEEIGIGATQRREACGPRRRGGKEDGCGDGGSDTGAFHDRTYGLPVGRDQGR